MDWIHIFVFFHMEKFFSSDFLRILNSEIIYEFYYKDIIFLNISSQIRMCLEMLSDCRNITMKNSEGKNIRKLLYHYGISFCFSRVFVSNVIDQENVETIFDKEFYKWNFKWNSKIHIWFPQSFKNTVETILLLSLFNLTTNQPQHPNCYFYELPRDIKFEIFKLIPLHPE